jgi:hypothetical protein
VEPREGELKYVTALFAEIKGSTELMRDIDPEEARERVSIRRCLPSSMRSIARKAPSCNPLGDGIFALFGAFIAHEDHPQRALYAALRIAG